MQRVKWTDELIEQLKELYEDGTPMEEICELMGVTVNQVNNKANRMKFKRGATLWTTEKIAEVAHYYSKTTLSVDEIVEKTGLTRESIRNKMKRLKITRPPELNTSTHKQGIDILLTWNSDFAWWLGWFLTDGSLWGTQFKIYNTEYEMIEKTKSIIQSENGFYTMPESETHYGDKPVYCFSFRSKRLRDYLQTIGVTNKRDFVPEMPEDMIPHFLRGMYEGDGCFSNGIWAIGGKKEVIEKVQDMIAKILPNYQIKSLQKREDCPDFYNLYITGKREALELGKVLYKDCGNNFLEYKKKKYDDWVYRLNGVDI